MWRREWRIVSLLFLFLNRPLALLRVAVVSCSDNNLRLRRFSRRLVFVSARDPLFEKQCLFEDAARMIQVSQPNWVLHDSPWVGTKERPFAIGDPSPQRPGLFLRLLISAEGPRG